MKYYYWPEDFTTWKILEDFPTLVLIFTMVAALCWVCSGSICNPPWPCTQSKALCATGNRQIQQQAMHV